MGQTFFKCFLLHTFSGIPSVQVMESNRTLERFMREVRQEEEAKATAAALFSADPSGSATCRQQPRTVGFAVVDKVTSPRAAATGSTRCSGTRPARSTTAGRPSTDDDFAALTGRAEAWKRQVRGVAAARHRGRPDQLCAWMR